MFQTVKTKGKKEWELRTWNGKDSQKKEAPLSLNISLIVYIFVRVEIVLSLGKCS